MFTNGFVDILAAEQTHESRDWFQGTADAVRKCLAFRHGPLALTQAHPLGGPALADGLPRLLPLTRERRTSSPVAMIPVPEADVPGFGIMKVDRNTCIVDFVEKPPLVKARRRCASRRRTRRSPRNINAVLTAKPYLASMGIYLFNNEVLAEMFRAERFNDFGKDIIPHAIKNWNVYGYLRRLLVRHRDHQVVLPGQPGVDEGQSEFEIYDAAYPVYTHARFLPSSKIFRCQIHSSIVSRGGAC